MLRRWAAPATAVGLSLGFALVWLRVVYLQVVQAEQYRQQLQRQAFARVLLLPERGTILDRRGEPLALSVKAPSYAVDPQQLRCAECLCRAAHALGLDSATCLQRIRSARGRFLWLLRSVWEHPTTALDTLSDPGLIRLQELHRVYPYGELTLPLLGSVNIDQVGISGVELSYDSLLRMPPVETLMRRDARGRLIPVPQSAAHSPPQPPMLRTTLDIELQQLIAYELQRGLERFRARSGVAIALEVRSGAIRAAVALPTPARGSATLPVVGEVYEPGSVLKPFIAAAALDQGLLRPEDTLDARNGEWSILGQLIRDEYPLGRTTLRRAFALSSNIVFAELAYRLPRRVLYRYVRDFGFGLPTGVDLPGEVNGIVPTPERMEPTTPLFWGFGYGLAVTPLQLACAYAAIGNGGVLVRPRVADALIAPDGTVLKEFPTERVRQVITEQTARQLLSLLRSVVEEGTGRAAALPQLPIAGKTGTARQLVEGRYSPQAHTASFVALLPAHSPRLVLLVMLQQPQEAVYGGQTAAPIVRRVLLRMLANTRLRSYIADAALTQHSSVHVPQRTQSNDTRAPDTDPRPRTGRAAATLLGGGLPRYHGGSNRAGIHPGAACGEGLCCSASAADRYLGCGQLAAQPQSRTPRAAGGAHPAATGALLCQKPAAFVGGAPADPRDRSRGAALLAGAEPARGAFHQRHLASGCAGIALVAAASLCGKPPAGSLRRAGGGTGI